MLENLLPNENWWARARPHKSEIHFLYFEMTTTTMMMKRKKNEKNGLPKKIKWIIILLCITPPIPLFCSSFVLFFSSLKIIHPFAKVPPCVCSPLDFHREGSSICGEHTKKTTIQKIISSEIRARPKKWRWKKIKKMWVFVCCVFG